MIRVLIADDEGLARDELRRGLEGHPGCELVGEARDGPEALAMLRERRPELLFLDIQMPGFDGFELLAQLSVPERPAVVFVTAYERYALRAFEVHAIDYLLKPFTPQRFDQALAHALGSLGRSSSEPLTRMLTWHQRNRGDWQGEPFPTRFTVSDRDGWRFVRVADVDWIESAGNYVQLHVGDATHLVRSTLAQIETALDPECFARIHRTTIVRLDRVATVHPGDGESYGVVLHDGRTLRMSARYRPRLLG